MINKSLPSKGINIRIPIIIPVKGRAFINQGSGVGFRVYVGFIGLRFQGYVRIWNTFRGIYCLWGITNIIESQMEKNMDQEMESVVS